MRELDLKRRDGAVKALDNVTNFMANNNINHRLMSIGKEQNSMLDRAMVGILNKFEPKVSTMVII